MPDPIKKQILDRVLSTLQPLKTNGTFRDISRQMDRLVDSKALPVLMIVDGPEKTHARTDTVWECRFTLELQIVFARPRDAAARKDVLVAEVEKTLEGDITLGGLGRILDAGNEQPVQGADSDQTHRSVLRYTIQYTRKIGDPYLAT
jgi:hypothetical protein